MELGELSYTKMRLISLSGNSHNVMTEFSFQYRERGEGRRDRVF